MSFVAMTLTCEKHKLDLVAFVSGIEVCPETTKNSEKSLE